MVRKIVYPMQPLTEKVSLILLCWLARVPVSASAQTCAIMFLGSAPLVWSRPAVGARPLADFGTAECRILTGLRPDRKLVSLSPYERRPNPHIGLPGHNGAGQNRKQNLTFSSQGGQIRTAACPAEPGTVYPAPGPSLVLAQRPTGC